MTQINSLGAASNPAFLGSTKQKDETGGAGFAEALAPEADADHSKRPFVGDDKFGSGQIGIEVRDGRVNRVFYYDNSGNKLTSSSFDAPAMLRLLERFDIPQSDLVGLADTLDEAGIAYKPYELYRNTGSDLGIDLRDLASGGLGTAYDWRVPVNVEAKGGYAAAASSRKAEFAEERGLVANPDVTTGKGIDPSKMGMLTSGDGRPLAWAVYQGSQARWFETGEQATEFAQESGGQILHFGADEKTQPLYELFKMLNTTG